MTTIRTATPDDAPLLAQLNDHVHALHVEHRPDLFTPAPDAAGHSPTPPRRSRAERQAGHAQRMLHRSCS
ncbi:hypothetical protein PUR71_25700 [Streptomyces sp. SP17BM10]|uniref:hypothetical protein n=1 Tax=Streptomyces sp. SP17BM10 TaxID=3002530 RepID=UPI002E790335|nr:hypothetical protein [Streptomyces sp. SP17BM10]MEE1786269.1 hypothetical protein [Streptomyces sp. SP17BM10]